MNKHKLKFAIFGNEFQSHKSVAIVSLLDYFKKKGAIVSIHKPFYDFLKSLGRITSDYVSSFEEDDFDADFIVSMGGDGTFLRTATLVGKRNIPMIGVNIGRLGFLADVLPDQIETAFEYIFNDDYKIEERTLLTIEADSGNLDTVPLALNDIAVLKRDNAAMISIKASIDGEYLTTYQADGLIVSTPTGSTAYSLSNGGPIIVPNTSTLCLTPVAPHSLTSRPIVISDQNEVHLQVESRSHNFLVAIDGRSVTLAEGSTIIIRKAPFAIKIVKQKSHNYFSSLRRKMMWGKDTRE